MTKHAIPTECLTVQWTGGPCIVHTVVDTHVTTTLSCASFMVLREHLTGKVAVYFHTNDEQPKPTLANAIVELETARKMWDSLLKNGFAPAETRIGAWNTT